MLKKTKITLFTSIACIFLGCLIFGITAINSNYNFNQLFYAYDYSSKEYSNNLIEINAVEINLNNVQLTVCASENDELKLVYNEYEKRKFLITEKTKDDETILNISIEKVEWTSYLTFNIPLKNTAKLYIPVDTTLPIKIHKNDDNVIIKDNAVKDKIVLI